MSTPDIRSKPAERSVPASAGSRAAAGIAGALILIIATACRSSGGAPASVPAPAAVMSLVSSGAGWRLAPDVRIRPLVPGVWLHISDARFPADTGPFVPSNGLLIVGDSGTTLIDTAWDDRQTALILGFARDSLHHPVTLAIITHAHSDRLGGLGALRAAGVRIVASSLTRARALATGLPVPDTIGGLTAPGAARTVRGLEMFYPGPAHTPDNLVVWLPAARVLFGGCMIRSAAATTLGNTADGVVDAWPASVARVQARYGAMARIVVPGHGDVGGVELLEHTRELASGG